MQNEQRSQPWLQIHPSDHVAVALCKLDWDTAFTFGAEILRLSDPIPMGHKFALSPIKAGAYIQKYGFPIGTATQDIQPGQWVHTHNMKTALSEAQNYSYHPVLSKLSPTAPRVFQGYARADGSVGIRNELWIIPTVGCVNDIAERLVREQEAYVKSAGIDGLYAYPHPYGCSQMGTDHESTREILADLVRHPNAGGVLVLGLGCENNGIAAFKALLGAYDENRIKFIICQDEDDELTAGAKCIRELTAYAGQFRREPISSDRLIVGLKCGGSDGLSGITANPLVGAFSDLLISGGGTAILTETPEMFGAEQLLMNRAESEDIFRKIVLMINQFKEYFLANGQVVYENPSPGNKEGGITTLEDKSLGCVQKGGTAPVSDVLAYGARVTKQGLVLLSGPGNDLVSTTAMTAAGAHMILFTTGRGTPFGAPVPTIKLSTNSALMQKKSNWIDFNAGCLADGDSIPALASKLFDYVLDTASGRVKTKNETNAYRSIAIHKNGVTL